MGSANETEDGPQDPGSKVEPGAPASLPRKVRIMTASCPETRINTKYFDRRLNGKLKKDCGRRASGTAALLRVLRRSRLTTKTLGEIESTSNFPERKSCCC